MCTILYRGINNNCIDIINPMGDGDISHMTYDQFFELFKDYSCGTVKHGNGPRDTISRIKRSYEGGVTKDKLRNLLDNFKTNILSSLSSHMDTMNANKKEEEADLALAIFHSKYKKKNPL